MVAGGCEVGCYSFLPSVFPARIKTWNLHPQVVQKFEGFRNDVVITVDFLQKASYSIKNILILYCSKMKIFVMTCFIIGFLSLLKCFKGYNLIYLNLMSFSIKTYQKINLKFIRYFKFEKYMKKRKVLRL